MTDGLRYLKNKLVPRIWPKWAKLGSKTRGFFCHFLKFGSLVLLEIVYNDSLQQSLSLQHLVEVKSTKKCSRLEFGPKGAKIGPKTRFFVIFSSLVHQFSLKLHTVIACNNVKYLVEVKPTRKYFGH